MRASASPVPSPAAARGSVVAQEPWLKGEDTIGLSYPETTAARTCVRAAFAVAVEAQAATAILEVGTEAIVFRTWNAIW